MTIEPDDDHTDQEKPRAEKFDARPRRGLGRIKSLLRQPRINVLPMDAAPIDRVSERMNNGYVRSPLSDTRPSDVEDMQGFTAATADRFLREEFISPKSKENAFWRDDAASARRYLDEKQTDDEPNDYSNVQLLVAASPQIDNKTLADIEATAPNKEALPQYQPDAEMARRLKFMRYLVHRGTFNEGMDGDELPQQYPSFADYDDMVDENDHLPDE